MLRIHRQIAVLVLFLGPAIASLQAGEPVCCDPVWTVRAGAIFLERTNPDDALLAVELGGPPPELVNAGDFDFGFKPGYELSAIRHRVFSTAWDVEVRYFEVDGWNATTPTVPATFPVFNYATPFFLAAPGTDIAGSYQSQLQSVEVNARKSLCDWLQVLVGIRYAELDEDGVALTESVSGASFIAATGTENDLIGAQLGADVLIASRGRFRLEGLAKAGIFHNSASNRTMVTLTGLPVVPGSAASGDQTAFLGEIGLTGLYQMTDCLSLRATYQTLWADGIASATDQFAVSDPLAGTATVNSTDSPFYHGAFVGLQIER